MEDSTLVYLILTLFALNVAGIAGVWSGIDRLSTKIDEFSTRLTVLETQHRDRHPSDVKS
jgi:hypothetical protein